jgi:hypothetical protein
MAMGRDKSKGGKKSRSSPSKAARYLKYKSSSEARRKDAMAKAKQLGAEREAR